MAWKRSGLTFKTMADTIFTQIRLSNGHAIDVLEAKGHHMEDAAELAGPRGFYNAQTVLVHLMTIVCRVNGLARDVDYFRNLSLADYTEITDVMNAQFLKVR